MRAITALQLRRRLGEMLDRASAGERIIVERDRVPLAMLVSFEEGMRLEEPEQDRKERALAALDRLRRLRERMAHERPDLVGLDLAAAVRSDRRRDDPESR